MAQEENGRSRSESNTRGWLGLRTLLPMRTFPSLVLISVAVYSCSLAMEEESSRPNIIFLLADDQRDNSFSGMGHPFVKTPNVDRLLQGAVRFKNAYIAEPVCSPSRVSCRIERFRGRRGCDGFR